MTIKILLYIFNGIEHNIKIFRRNSMKSLCLALLFSALMLFIPTNRVFAEKVLSIDIGKERIKAAIIDSEKLTPGDLKEVKVYTLATKDFFPRRGDQLFDPAAKKGLIPLVGEEFDSVYVLIRQPAPDLQQKLSARLHKPVIVQRTAVGTMDGLLFWSSVSGHDLAYPVARVDFGRHISIGYAENSSEDHEIKLQDVQAPWGQLVFHSKGAGKPDNKMQGWATRMKGPEMKGPPMNRGFREMKNRFTAHWVQKAMNHRFERAKSGNEKRVNAMVRSVNKFLRLVLPQVNVALNGAQVKTLVIGGGYANLLKKDQINLGDNYKDIRIILTNEEQLKTEGVDADLIPLLGVFAHRGAPVQH